VPMPRGAMTTSSERRASIWRACRPFVLAYPLVLVVQIAAIVAHLWWLGTATTLVYVVWGTVRVTRASR
jgi:hypothetical protein